jgi:hypothetical protein
MGSGVFDTDRTKRFIKPLVPKITAFSMPAMKNGGVTPRYRPRIWLSVPSDRCHMSSHPTCESSMELHEVGSALSDILLHCVEFA